MKWLSWDWSSSMNAKLTFSPLPKQILQRTVLKSCRKHRRTTLPCIAIILLIFFSSSMIRKYLVKSLSPNVPGLRDKVQWLRCVPDSCPSEFWPKSHILGARLTLISLFSAYSSFIHSMIPYWGLLWAHWLHFTPTAP